MSDHMTHPQGYVKEGRNKRNPANMVERYSQYTPAIRRPHSPVLSYLAPTPPHGCEKPSGCVLLLCLVDVYWQPCDAVASSSMVCGSEVMVDKQTVEPLEWWPDEKDPCPPDQWLCRDRKNCIPRNATCSSTTECEDGSDESPRFCGCKEDEFHCGDLCIKCSQRCDKVKHCVHGEDEQDCLTHTCPSNFFQCVSDGVCVPQKAMCNHTSECADSSDEDHCQRFRSCYSSEFQCDNKQCVRPFAVCDDYQDCADNSDEKECQPSDFVTCKSGKKIHKFWWCNNFPDCSENYHDDDTDELNCTCGEEHFRCHNSRCIFKGNVCDSKCDCQGCEDEVDCRHVYVNDSGVTECLKGKSVECNGRCIAKEFICDGIRHCYGEDLTEFGCYDYKNKMFRHPAEAKQKRFSFFQCKDLRSLPSILLCDGQRHCLDGEDEEHCGEEGACGPKQFRCLNGSCIPDKAKCDGIEDCELGFDEMHCKDQTDQAGCTSDEWRCVRIGQCIPRSGRCDSNPDCIDSSDELYCANNTCGEDQWRCFSGHCVSKSVQCDSVFDCKDKSDEKYCDEYKCRPGTMKCKSGQCVATEAWCNGTKECPDGSDEQKCVPRECHSDEFRCANGQCVPLSHRCHVFFDHRDSCLDLSHLINCTEAPCGKGKIKCFRGPCIDEELRCDGRAQCPLTWEDENNCPFRCSGAGDKCGCLDQEVKCFNLSLTEFPTVENNINKYLFAYNRIGETFDQKRIEGHSNVVFL
ncbi:hypothetical protein O3P69_007363 [Scylla paramamosain]|uniref:Uncharacterized protein n=1 Tax=Scylla paramamosain TaxID=85552 RepID=A0AAW0V418_SCYPA